MKKRMNPLSRQSGFTLVEIAIVVAVGALLLAGVASAPRILDGNRANQEISELPQIVNNIRKVFSNQATFGTVGDDILPTVIPLNAFPPERVNLATNVANNRFGGAVTAVVATTSNAGDSVTLTSGNVPSRVCSDIIPQIEGNFASISVAATAVKTAGGTLNLGTLGTQCNSAANVAIAYTFTK